MVGSVDVVGLANNHILDYGPEAMFAEVYDPSALHACPGHWDRSLAWQEGHMWPQDAILTDIIEAIQRKKACVQ